VGLGVAPKPVGAGILLGDAPRGGDRRGVAARTSPRPSPRGQARPHTGPGAGAHATPGGQAPFRAHPPARALLGLDQEAGVVMGQRRSLPTIQHRLSFGAWRGSAPTLKLLPHGEVLLGVRRVRPPASHDPPHRTQSSGHGTERSEASRHDTDLLAEDEILRRRLMARDCTPLLIRTADATCLYHPFGRDRFPLSQPTAPCAHSAMAGNPRSGWLVRARHGEEAVIIRIP
jgi:hypothetical protein